MDPSPTDLFWTHIPSWGWPLIILGVLGFFLVQAVRGYEGVSKCFGPIGRHLYAQATAKAVRRVNRSSGVDITLLKDEMSNVLDYVQRMELTLTRSSDDLECAIAYLVSDASWHHDVDIILAEHFPTGVVQFPHRVPFSVFSFRWREGWRPTTYFKDGA